MRTRIAGALFTAAAIAVIGASGAGAATATAEPLPAGPAPLCAGGADSRHRADCGAGRMDRHRAGSPHDTVETWSDGAGHRISAAHHWTSDRGGVDSARTGDDDRAGGAGAIERSDGGHALTGGAGGAG